MDVKYSLVLGHRTVNNLSHFSPYNGCVEQLQMKSKDMYHKSKEGEKQLVSFTVQDQWPCGLKLTL